MKQKVINYILMIWFALQSVCLICFSILTIESQYFGLLILGSLLFAISLLVGVKQKFLKSSAKILLSIYSVILLVFALLLTVGTIMWMLLLFPLFLIVFVKTKSLIRIFIPLWIIWAILHFLFMWYCIGVHTTADIYALFFSFISVGNGLLLLFKYFIDYVYPEN